MTAPTVCVAVRFQDNPLVSWGQARLAAGARGLPRGLAVAARAFSTLGFSLSAVGSRCIVLHVDPEVFNQHFATKLESVGLSPDYSHRILWSLGRSSVVDFRGPLERYTSRRGVNAELQLAARVVLATVETITIQRPHEFTATAPAFPKLVEPLDVLAGVRGLLKVDLVMAQPGGCTGKGVRVAMIDTGFAHDHPFFKRNGFRSTVLLAGAATNAKTDPHGHGTGESANLFSTAPGIDFVGVKTYDGSDPDNNAYALEGFIAAMGTLPDIVSMSFAYDLCEEGKKTQMSELPDYVEDLAFEIDDAIASRGTIVVAAAGNDQYGFPGQMPGVISVGGANVHDGKLRASDFTSAFKSGITVYPDRWVPDVCGLVGMQPTGAYIDLPVPKTSQMFTKYAGVDRGAAGTFASFSGSSAATPQVAGVCALLLEKLRKGGLTSADVLGLPARVKTLLRDHAVDVKTGKSRSDAGHTDLGGKAKKGVDKPTGAGLVDALASLQAIP